MTRPKLQFTLRFAFVALTIAAILAFWFRPKSTPVMPIKYPKLNDGNAQIEYNRFTLIRVGHDIIALHILPDPRYGWNGVTYRWYHLDDGTDVFLRPSPEPWPATNPNVTTGAGETDEGEAGSGWINAGPLSVEWSKGNQNLGWLYLSGAADVVQIYPDQFDRLDEFSGNLDAKRWIRAHFSAEDVSGQIQRVPSKSSTYELLALLFLVSAILGWVRIMAQPHPSGRENSQTLFGATNSR